MLYKIHYSDEPKTQFICNFSIKKKNITHVLYALTIFFDRNILKNNTKPHDAVSNEFFFSKMLLRVLMTIFGCGFICRNYAATL